MTDKALEAAAREIAANHWSVDSNMGKQEYQDAHWQFHVDDAEAAISAYLSALPGEAEVVGLVEAAIENVRSGHFYADYDRAVSDLEALSNGLASLQAMQARAEKALEPFAFTGLRVDLSRFDEETGIEVHFPRTSPRKAIPVARIYVEDVLRARTALKGGSNED